MRPRPICVMSAAMMALAVAGASRVTAVEYKVTLLPVPHDLSNVFINSTDGMIFGGVAFDDVRNAIIVDGTLTNSVNLNPEGFHESGIEDVSGEYQVGWANKPGPGMFPISHAMLWNGTAESVVDLHPERFEGSAAVDVSGEYQVGSGWINSGAINHALLWNGTAGSAVELTPDGYWFSEGKGISGDSQVGYAVPDTPTGTPHAMLWRGTAERFVDLHPARFRNSDTLSVSGDVQVGFGSGPSGQRALMWRGTAESVVDLHPPGFDDYSSFAWDVAGNVQVGFVETLPFDPEPKAYAFAWHGTAESAVNLHSYLEELGPEFTSSSAFSVADDGTIFGHTSGNIAIWTPIASCDFDQDGACGVSDIDAMVSQIVASTNDAAFDLTDDGVVNGVDLSRWLSDAGDHNGFSGAFLVGDANLDGTVNASDLNSLGQNWQQSPNTWTMGDFNADGVADANDLNSLGTNWQASTPVAAQARAVPEPTSAGLLSFGLVIMIWKRRLHLESSIAAAS